MGSAPSTPNCRLLVPAYFAWHSPEGKQSFSTLLDGLKLVPDSVVILNASSGPAPADWPFHADLQAYAEQLHGASLHCVAYVWTDYGKRAIADVLADMKAWTECVPASCFDGFFFDCVSLEYDTLSYYSSLCKEGTLLLEGRHVHVLNPGINCDDPAIARSLQGMSDIMVWFESDCRHYDRLEHKKNCYSSTDPTLIIPKERDDSQSSAVMIHDCVSWRSTYQQLTKSPVRYIYITNHTLNSNPWLDLPLYWMELCQTISAKKR
jgi:hypothetical protein